jgi:hypothetical protein
MPLTAPVRVRYGELEWPSCTTVDMSEGGVFVDIPGHGFRGGEVITLQVCNLEDAPLVVGQVVRATAGGIGVAFLDDAGEDE